jgi:hypothetical protein
VHALECVKLRDLLVVSVRGIRATDNPAHPVLAQPPGA